MRKIIPAILCLSLLSGCYVHVSIATSAFVLLVLLCLTGLFFLLPNPLRDKLGGALDKLVEDKENLKSLDDKYKK